MEGGGGAGGKLPLCAPLPPSCEKVRCSRASVTSCLQRCPATGITWLVTTCPPNLIKLEQRDFNNYRHPGNISSSLTRCLIWKVLTHLNVFFIIIREPPDTDTYDIMREF